MTKERELAEKIVAYLFRGGAGAEADRLVLTIDGPPRRYLGGWGRGPATVTVERILRGESEQP